MEAKSINKIIFNSRDELIRLNVDKIVFFESQGNYTNIVMANKLQYMVRMNLGETEKALAAHLGAGAAIFIRIGKQHIINSNFIASINIIKQHLLLSDYSLFAYKLSVSREALKRLKELMQTKSI